MNFIGMFVFVWSTKLEFFVEVGWSALSLFECHLKRFADNLSKKFGSQINELWDSFGQDFTYPGNLPTYVEEYYEEEMSPTRALNSDLIAGSVQCLPLPGKKETRGQVCRGDELILLSFVILFCAPLFVFI